MKKKKLFLCTIFLVALMLLGSLTFTAGAAEVSAANNTVGTVQLRAVSRISSQKVRLTWNKVPQANGYRVYRKTGNSSWKALKNGSAAAWACTDTTVKPGTKYTYTVRAYRRVNGKVIWGGYDKKGLTVTIPKAANTSVGTVRLGTISTISSTKVRLTWNRVSQASGYRVYRKTGNSDWKVLKNGSAAAWACTDTTVKPGTKYTYTVRAYRRVNGKVVWGGYDKNGLTVTVSGKVVEMTNYFQQGVSKSEMQRLITDIGGMKKSTNSKYPSLYYTGNNMTVGVNLNALYGTYKDEYVRIRNSGNTNVQFYGVKIGDTKQQMESKFRKYNIQSYDGGKTYTNANAWQVKVVFSGGKLKEYTYICAPTSR